MARYNSDDHTQHENDNRSDQMNPNNDTYWSDRDCDERPDDWEDQLNPES
jgi:hypothetical protein